ncbi:hypothetical protein ACPV1J_002589 [Escherichia coli]
MKQQEPFSNTGTIWLFDYKYHAVIEKRKDGTDISHVLPHGGKSLCMGKIIADLIPNAHANKQRN